MYICPNDQNTEKKKLEFRTNILNVLKIYNL